MKIARVGPEGLEELRPLWLALRDHHGRVMPQLGPVRDDEDSWRQRRADYERWLAEPGAFLLVAREERRALGYALVRPSDEVSATWPRGGRTALLESLVVAPDARGAGLGSALLSSVRDECTRRGYEMLTVGAVTGNREAIRFYEREGFAQEAVLLRDTSFGPRQSGQISLQADPPRLEPEAQAEDG